MFALRRIAVQAVSRARPLVAPRALAVGVGARRPLAASFASSAGETIRLTMTDGDGDNFEIAMVPGQRLHEAALDAGVDLECACDGEAMCSTCHCIFTEDVFDLLPEASEEEEDMLDLALGLTETSRLACQVKYQKELDKCHITLPNEVQDFY